MRTLAMWCLATGPMMAVGWPNHWIVAGASFVAGVLAAMRPHEPQRDRRPGYVHPPSALGERVGRYTGRGRG